MGIFKRIPFEGQHIGLTARVLSLPARRQIHFAFRRVKQAAAGVLNILHTRAAAVGFAFRVDGIERHAQFFAAVVGIQGKFFVVFTVTVARGIAVAQLAVGTHAEFFVFAEALTQVECALSTVVAEPAQTDFTVAFICSFFGLDIDGTGYRAFRVHAVYSGGRAFNQLRGADLHAGCALRAVHTCQTVDAELARIKLITAEIQAGQCVAFAAELPNGSVFFRYGIHQSTRFGVVEGLFVVVDDGNRRGKGIGFAQYAQVHAVAQVAVAGDGVRTGGFDAFGVGADMDFLQLLLHWGFGRRFIGGIRKCAHNQKRHQG